MLFWQFSNIITYVKIVGKIPDQHLSVWLISNQGDNVQILVESTGQICPVVLHLFWTLSPGLENNHTLKCWSDIFPTILLCWKIATFKCMVVLQFYSSWNLMKPGSQSGTYAVKQILQKIGLILIKIMLKKDCQNLTKY